MKWLVICALLALATIPPAAAYTYYNESIRIRNYEALQFDGSDNMPRAEMFVRPTEEYVMKYRLDNGTFINVVDVREYAGWPQMNIGLFSAAPLFLQVADPRAATAQDRAVNSNCFAISGEYWDEQGVISDPRPQSLHRQWVMQTVMYENGTSDLVFYYGKIENNGNDHAPLRPVMKLNSSGQLTTLVNATAQEYACRP